MQLYYWKSAQGNVGDDLNPWLWSRVFGDAFFDGDPRERLVAVGASAVALAAPDDRLEASVWRASDGWGPTRHLDGWSDVGAAAAVGDVRRR